MEFLIATALTCADVSEMVDRIERNNTVSGAAKQEIVDIYKIHLVEATGLECNWDANAD
jgi:hypothetical protein|tara:strand:- start:40 stop:216 length:177 start_codon:yes stop_codon:yes gene_type:complete